MCKCTPEIRTPFCGKPGCEWPEQQPTSDDSAAGMSAERAVSWVHDAAIALGEIGYSELRSSTSYRTPSKGDAINLMNELRRKARQVHESMPTDDAIALFIMDQAARIERDQQEKEELQQRLIRENNHAVESSGQVLEYGKRIEALEKALDRLCGTKISQDRVRDMLAICEGAEQIPLLTLVIDFREPDEEDIAWAEELSKRAAREPGR